MGKVKTAYMKATMDDMGDLGEVSIGELEEAHMEFEASKTPALILIRELNKRGYIVTGQNEL